MDRKKGFNNVEDIYELTHIQQEDLQDYLAEKQDGLFHESLVFVFKGMIDQTIFKKCWEECINKHSILRTGFFYKDMKQPVQVVFKKTELPLEFTNWTDISAVEGKERLKKVTDNDKSCRYEMEKAPLMRMQLIQCKDDYYLFSWRFHHIIMDGWAFAIVMSDILELYRKESGAAMKGVLSSGYPFKEYVQYCKFRDRTQEQQFWKNYLSELEPQHPLTRMRVPHPEPSRFKHGRMEHSMSVYYQELDNTVKEYNLNLNSVFQSIYVLLISHLSNGGSDIVTGQIAADRPLELPESGTRVGLFANTIPIRSHIDRQKKFSDWAKEMQTNILQIFQYAASSRQEINTWLGISDHDKLFDNVLIFENVPIDADPFAGLPFHLVETVLESHLNYSFQLYIWPDENLKFKFTYDTAIYDESAILLFLGKFKHLLEVWLNEPQITIRDLMKKIEG